MIPIVVVGPTAVGKSAFGMRLCQAIGGEVVNADALQVYRGFDIGTAKPSIQEREGIRHHLIDIKSPEETFSAGEFAHVARASIREIIGRGKIPVVVGGSGLYIRALFGGICDVPKVDPAIRMELMNRVKIDGLSRLYEELAYVDPPFAIQVKPNDSQRIVRGLEVFFSTGKGLSEWWGRATPKENLDRIELGLTVPRTILYDRIAVRVLQMVERGWLDEVSNLLRQGITPTTFAFQAIGYRQLTQVALGQSCIDRAVGEIIRSTRQYAKRQETWFRRERDVFWIQGPRAEAAIPFVLQELKRRGALAR